MTTAIPPAMPVEMERARGAVRLTVGRRDGRNEVADLAQSGCARLLFPAIAAGTPREAVIVNTSGGLTGGDRFSVAIDVAPAASAVVSTQACERLYRSTGADVEVATRIRVAAQARLCWLPQETILFEAARLARSLEVDIAAGARFLGVEAMLLGRRASGETLTSGSLRDSWRIRREGRLIFADETAFDGDLSKALAHRPTLGATSAYATVILVADDAENRLETVRQLPIIDACEAGFSAFDGLFVARLIAQDGACLRARLLPLLRALGADLPLVWSL